MAVQVIKKDRETSQNLVHRFTKTVRGSGLLIEVRSKQFKKRGKSDLAKKRSALRRVQLKIEKKRQEKLEKPKPKTGRY